MSKTVFASILKSKLQLNRFELESYWLQALNARLPQFVLELISPEFLRLPSVYQAYVNNCGFEPVILNKDQARRLILEALIEGPRYMTELRALFTISKEMRLEVITELLEEKTICFNYCPIGKCIAYELNRRIRIPDNLLRRLNSYLALNQRVSLYRFSLMATKYDYSILCVMAGRIQERDNSSILISRHKGQVYLTQQAVIHE